MTRYLPNHELQDDAVVEGWLGLIGDVPAWPNPGRLGQYEACLAWPGISVPCLILAFEHDVDSPPARSQEPAAITPVPGS